MFDLIIYNRLTKQLEKEQIYGKYFLHLLYGKGLLPFLVSKMLLLLCAKLPFFSWAYGVIQKSPLSRNKVIPFIEKFSVDETEFEKKKEDFSSFNDFFIRKLRKGTRSIVQDNHLACLPADARYLAFENIKNSDSFFIKGKKFCLKALLQNEDLASRYEHGSMLIARLCPTDYHRFHFPLDCTPTKSKLINGLWYSVNPIALKRNIEIITENKRMLTHLKTKDYGEVLYLEVGATCVGEIHQTFLPNRDYQKGDEKGFFSFGGSCLILLFEPKVLKIDSDLLEKSQELIETKALMGQSLGRLQKKA